MNNTPIDLSRVESAIIDLDGTLVDTLGDFEVALNRTMADLGLPGVDRAAVARTVGKGSEHLIRCLLAEQLARPEVRGLGQACPARTADALYDQAWQRYQQHYHQINGQFAEVFPGVVEGLQSMSDRGLRLACLTNKPLAFARVLLKAKGLEGFFGPVFGGDSFERKKPDPLPILKSCEALGSPPARTLVVGDSQNDGLAARAAGCPVVLVTYGYNHGDPIEEAPHDRLIRSLAELA